MRDEHDVIYIDTTRLSDAEVTELLAGLADWRRRRAATVSRRVAAMAAILVLAAIIATAALLFWR